jgi:hypothetical protein
MMFPNRPRLKLGRPRSRGTLLETDVPCSYSEFYPMSESAYPWRSRPTTLNGLLILQDMGSAFSDGMEKATDPGGGAEAGARSVATEAQAARVGRKNPVRRLWRCQVARRDAPASMDVGAKGLGVLCIEAGCRAFMRRSIRYSLGCFRALHAMRARRGTSF